MAEPSLSSRILAQLHEQGASDPEPIAQALGVTRKQVVDLLGYLRGADKVERNSFGAYEITEAGQASLSGAPAAPKARKKGRRPHTHTHTHRLRRSSRRTSRGTGRTSWSTACRSLRACPRRWPRPSGRCDVALIVITIQDREDGRVSIDATCEPAMGRPCVGEPTGAQAAAVRMLGSLDFEQERQAQPGAGLIRLS